MNTKPLFILLGRARPLGAPMTGNNGRPGGPSLPSEAPPCH